MRPQYGPAGDIDARAVYLFHCKSTNCYGITLDPTGANLPDQGCAEGWQRKSEFPLGVREAVPAPMNPEPILRGIAVDGYFVWREGPVMNPSGTSQ